ncbi:hypothetical protein AALB39_04515 [Lachnospiraceae bacterium 54-53]
MDENYPALAVKVQEVESRGKSNEHRIDKLEDSMEKFGETQIALVKMANSIEVIGKSVVSMDGKVSKIQESQDALTIKVSEIENRPAKQSKQFWDNIFNKVAWVFMGGIVVWILTQLLPNIPW